MNKDATKPCTRCGTAEIPNMPCFKYCKACRKEVDRLSKNRSAKLLRLAGKLTTKSAISKPPTPARLIAPDADAAQLAINADCRRRDDLRCGYKVDPGRSVPKSEWGKIIPTITPIDLIPRFHYADGAIQFH